MLPIASASGIALITVVVVSAAAFMTWLLRGEPSEDAADEQADARTPKPGPRV
jgi:hypothetical protein